MNTVIKGTKTIAEYKRVREDMENLARANYARHKEAFEEWGEGEPVKAWFDLQYYQAEAEARRQLDTALKQEAQTRERNRTHDRDRGI